MFNGKQNDVVAKKKTVNVNIKNNASVFFFFYLIYDWYISAPV